jgi:formylglycine-generating enzyme required for sulfatase activity
MGSPPGELGHSLSEGPQHEVVITRPFYMKTTEVTQKEWMSLMGNNPSHYPDCGLDCPVEVVSWWDAVTYGNAISRALGLPECYELSSCVGTPGQPGYSCLDVVFTGLDCPGYRLPTEAEWEYAYRAGRTTAFYNGGITAIECDPIDISLYDIGWYCSNSMDRTHPAGLKIANAWGLYDMAGNVGEWTWDRSWRDYSTETVTDPLGPDDGTYRVVRGGNYVDGAVFCRAASRYNGPPGGRSSGSGFRLVRSGP